MNSEYESKIDYVEDVLGFHFESGFKDAITSGGIDVDELNKWVSLAVLFALSSNEVNLSKRDYVDGFLLIEDLYTSLSVDLQLGEPIESFDLEDVGCGYDIPQEKFKSLLEIALSILREKGIDLSRLVE